MSQRGRYERLINSGLPNFITMQAMSEQERINVLNEFLKKAREDFIQEIKERETAEREKAASKVNECNSHVTIWI